MLEYECLSPPDLSDHVHPPAALSSSEQILYDIVLAHFSSADYALGEEEGSLSEEEQLWLSHECITRYLCATKWTTAQEAIKRLEATLQWRREFGLYDGTLSPEVVEPEALTGKHYIYGYDIDGRPALYLVPSKQNTDESIRQLQFLVFMAERAVDLMDPGVETMAIMVDWAEKGKNPSISMSKQVLNVLQSHYPERLGRFIHANVPWVVNMFLKVMLPFVDPVTRPKVRFNPQPVEDGLFVADQLVANWGGTHEFEYDHKQYWGALVRLCAERRGEWIGRWRELGAKVGLREWDFKGGKGTSPEAVAPKTGHDERIVTEKDSDGVELPASELKPVIVAV